MKVRPASALSSPEAAARVSRPHPKRQGIMKIFLDTASLTEIREAATLGVVDGITTNPSLLAKEKGDPEEILVEICKTIDGPISAEVVATDAEGMIEEGRHLASLHENIVVKFPCIAEGLKATKVLTAEGKRVNMTLVFSPRRRCSRPRPARATCRRSSAGSTTSRPRAWSWSRTSSRSSTTTTTSARCSRPACAIRCTWSRRRAWAPTSAPCR